MSDIPSYQPSFLHNLWLSDDRRTPGADAWDHQRIHMYDVSADRLSEARRIPRTTRDIFQDFSDVDDNGEETCLRPFSHQQSDGEEETPFHASSRAANVAFHSLERDVEVILDRILLLVTSTTPGSRAQDYFCNATTTTANTALTTSTSTTAVVSTIPTATCFEMSKHDLDVLCRYFVFLHFRNGGAYAKMVHRMFNARSGEQTQRSEPEQGQQRLQDLGREPCLSARVSEQIFLAGAAHFLGLHPIETPYLGNTELLKNCWRLCDAQVSIGLAPAQAEYIHTEQLFGSLDDARDEDEVHRSNIVYRCSSGVESRCHSSFFFPISPKTALYIRGGLANALGKSNGTVLIDCVHEDVAKVHLRNAAMSLRAGSIDGGRTRVVYFSSLRATAESLASIGCQRPNGERGDGDNDNRWCDRLRERCLEKQAREAAAKRFIFRAGHDDEEDGKPNMDDKNVGSGQAGGCHRRGGEEGLGSAGRAHFMVNDLTDQVTFQPKRGPCGYGSLSDVYKGELTPPLGVAEGMPVRIVVKCMRRHAVDSHMGLLRDEVAVWHTLQHRHIAQLFGIIRLENGDGSGTGKAWLGMVSLWCENGTILQYLVNHPFADRLRLLIEVAMGCSYLHNYLPVVIHGDLKCSNILVDADGRAIITDFGRSRVIQEVSCSDHRFCKDDQQNRLQQQQMAVSTPSSLQSSTAARWLAPELIHEEASCDHAPPISTASDVYSFGCVCLEVATGEAPFPQQRSNCAVVFHVLTHGTKPSASGSSERARPLAGIPPRAGSEFWALLDRCWSAQPMRPSMDVVVRVLSRLHNTCS